MVFLIHTFTKSKLLVYRIPCSSHLCPHLLLSVSLVRAILTGCGSDWHPCAGFLLQDSLPVRTPVFSSSQTPGFLYFCINGHFFNGNVGSVDATDVLILSSSLARLDQKLPENKNSQFSLLSLCLM